MYLHYKQEKAAVLWGDSKARI